MAFKPLDFSMKTLKRSYQAASKDFVKMTKDEPRQLPDKPKASKTTKPELKLDKAEPKTETGTTNKTLLQLGTTEGRGACYRGYPSPPQSPQSPCYRREIKVEQPWPDGDSKKSLANIQEQEI